jgi:transposase
LAKKQLRQMASKKGKKLRVQTLEYAEYVILFTTVNRHNLKSEDVLQLYRGRWQIELAFKRLKSIIGIGHLPKYDPDSCIAWLYGKMMVALLVERLYREAESFSPWGYPLRYPPEL